MHTISLSPHTFSIRLANASDSDTIIALDANANDSAQRSIFIKRTTEAGTNWVIVANEQVVGYAVLEYTFYEYGFVSMLYIHPAYRHQGAGEKLMRYLESICRTPKLFTSTNLSNVPMQSLLTKLGYILSGVIHHLDENDPELVYVKFMNAG